MGLKKEKLKLVIGILTALGLFIAASVFVQNNLDMVKTFIDGGPLSILIYIAILVVATVIAPINALFLMPIASGVWGWALTAFFSLIGWTIGAVIAFALARIYGLPLVKKFVSWENVEKFEKLLPKKNRFWGIVLLRMAIPSDIWSYAIGLFSKIEYRDYALATVIAFVPHVIMLAYLGTLSLVYLLASLAAILVISIFSFKMALEIMKRLNVNLNKEVGLAEKSSPHF